MLSPLLFYSSISAPQRIRAKAAETNPPAQLQDGVSCLEPLNGNMHRSRHQFTVFNLEKPITPAGVYRIFGIS